MDAYAVGSRQRAVGSGPSKKGTGAVAAGRIGSATLVSATDPVPFCGTRRGVSLLEVLIAMFVITIGLLGVAALVPTGQFAVVESTKADRGSACGRAALSEVQTQRFLNPGLWCAFAPNASPVGWYPFGGATTPEVAARISYGDAFVIDPLFVAENRVYPPPGLASPYGPLAAFPYDRNFPPGSYGGRPRAYLDRVTFSNLAGDDVLPPTLAERIFRWHDDLAFQVARGSSDERTRSVYLWADNSTPPKTAIAAAPIRETPSPVPNPTNSVRLRQEHEGNYSWMMSVSPVAAEIDSTGRFSFQKYDVSVAVFFRRDLAWQPIDPSNPPKPDPMPSERPANLVFNSGGYGGGDATIYLPVAVGNALGFSGPTTTLGAQQYEAYLKVKKDTWIMLLGWQVDDRLPTNRFTPPLASPTNWRRVARWYRVVIADEEVQSGPIFGEDACYRNVTLAGPDWDTGRSAAQQPGIWDATLAARPGAGASPTATAVLVDGVIGVYTRTVEVD